MKVLPLPCRQLYLDVALNRVVTKISSCRANTTSRRGVKQLGISFGSIFLLLAGDHIHSRWDKSPAPGPRPLMTALGLDDHVELVARDLNSGRPRNKFS